MTTIRINTSNRTNTVSPILYGIFFEDINYAGDGGLYAELIANRSFEYFDPNDKKDFRKLCWETIGECDFSILTRFPISSAHQYYARLTGGKGCGIRNLGFCEEGFAVHPEKTFRFSCYARNASPMSIRVRLVDREGTVYCDKELYLVRAGHGWTKYNMSLTVSGECKHVYPEILLGREGIIDLDLISIFPSDTFHNRPNGVRKDMAEMLQALSPKFMRFPGGCIVEGRSFENMYNWKDTVGDLTRRRTNWNRWQLEEYQLEGCSSQDYFQSYGLGYYEYFQLCEDLGAKPVPVMNAGMPCQWHEGLLAEMDSLDKWIQDVLDLIEFANGAADSQWGALRAQMGHPEPFGLEYIGIGNEQWGQEYFCRYEAFQKAISQKYPEIKLITSAGHTVEGKNFHTAYDWMKANRDKAYAVDEHFYKSPEWFVENCHRYDVYDRTLPKVFAGEYAAHTCGSTKDRENNWYAALCEAAFLTGLEKNADHVVMSCYAPLFGRPGHQQWQPNLIWFDNDNVYGTPNYYVQKLFSNHVGASLVETAMEASDALDDFDGELSCTLSQDGSHLYVKLVNLSEKKEKVSVVTDRLPKGCTLHELAASPDAVNSHAQPTYIYPSTMTLPLGKDALPQLTLPGYSVTVLDIVL